jgi:hypothetical protein
VAVAVGAGVADGRARPRVAVRLSSAAMRRRAYGLREALEREQAHLAGAAAGEAQDGVAVAEGLEKGQRFHQASGKRIRKAQAGGSR